MNANQVYAAIEKLVLDDKLKEAEHFMRDVIVPHFASITNLNELISIFIRLCSSVRHESRIYFCKEFISPISYELTKKKFHKKFAEIFFDFILAILDLHIIEALTCAYRILNINEFYPWKQLDKQLTHLIQSCSTYDQIINDSTFSELGNLSQILRLIQQRAKANITIFHATHEVALQAILKWSNIVNKDTGKSYSRHVFEMGEAMTELVDQQKITTDTCIRLIEILQKRIDDNDEPRDFNQPDDRFLMVSLIVNRKKLFIL